MDQVFTLYNGCSGDSRFLHEPWHGIGNRPQNGFRLGATNHHPRDRADLFLIYQRVIEAGGSLSLGLNFMKNRIEVKWSEIYS